MKMRRIIPLALVFVALGVLCLTPLFAQSRKALPVLWDIPDFHLLNTKNILVSKATLKDKVWVADFIFTTCAGPCPEMTKRMAKLADEFKDEPDVRFVSITVNPNYDTPQVLADYGKLYNADFSRWSFLTGDPAAIQKLTSAGFKLGSVDQPLMHSTRFCLVDKKGRMRASYIATDNDAMRRLPGDIKSLLKE